MSVQEQPITIKHIAILGAATVWAVALLVLIIALSRHA